MPDPQKFDPNGSYASAHTAKAAFNPSGDYAPASVDVAAISKATGLSAQPKPFSSEWFKQGLWRTAASIADVAPAAGATIGAMIGAPEGPVAAIGGAGVGGGGGTALQQMIRRGLGYPNAPQTSAQAAQDITKQATTQAAIQGATELLPFAAGPLKRSAETQYERALAPTTAKNKVIASKIAPELIQRGEYGSLGGLNQAAQDQAAQIKPHLDTAYGNVAPAATRGSGTQIVNDLEGLKGKYIVNGIPANPQAINAITGVQEIVQQFGQDIAPDDLRKLKSIFDDPVAQKGGYAGADLASAHTLQAQKVAANSIRSIMSSASPDVAALNKELSFWLNVQKVTKDSAIRQTGQAGGLTKVLTPVAAGAAAATTGVQFGAHAGVEAGLLAGLTAAAYQVTRSTAWRTASAVAKDSFAEALARGDVGAVTALASRFGVAGAQSYFQPNQGATGGSDNRQSGQ